MMMLVVSSGGLSRPKDSVHEAVDRCNRNAGNESGFGSCPLLYWQENKMVLVKYLHDEQMILRSLVNVA